MKLLFAVHGYKPAWRIGGPITSVSSVAERLVQKGHQVFVFTSNSNLDEDLDVPINQEVLINGVQVRYFEHTQPLKQLFPNVSYLAKSIGFLYCRGMRAMLDEVVPGVDAVHTHLPFMYPTYAAANAAFRHRKPLFYHQRGVFDPARLSFRSLKKRIYLSAIELPILRRATTLFALTDAERSSYKALGIDTPTSVIPNGIDLPPTVEVRREIPEFGIHSDDQIVLFLGRIHPIKGADKLLESFIRISAQVPQAKLVLAGPDEFGVEAGYRERVASAGLSGRVVFPGMVTGDLKQALLHRADLFCLPSDAEGFSMAVLEALASSTACLLSPGCYFPEVETAGAGRIAESSPEMWAPVLLEMLRDKASLITMGQLGRELVAQRYSWDAIADQFIDVYSEGIARHVRER